MATARITTLLLGQVLLLASLWLTVRARRRRERELGFEEPAPYEWPKPPRPSLAVRHTAVSKALLVGAGGLMAVSFTLLVIEIAAD